MIYPIPPRAFDLADPQELKRLLFEVTGYLRVSRLHGSDVDGRAFALEALERIGARVRINDLTHFRNMLKAWPAGKP